MKLSWSIREVTLPAKFTSLLCVDVDDFHGWFCVFVAIEQGSHLCSKLIEGMPDQRKISESTF